MERSDLVWIYTAHDVGEYGFIRSLLEANEILPFCPDQQAEALSMWTNAFFRQYTIYVAPKDGDRAKELIAVHRQDEPTKGARTGMQWVARFLLIWTGLTILGSFLSHARYFFH